MSEKHNRVVPYSVIPKYQQLADILVQEIEDGRWDAREAIPSERELEDLYNVSRTTVRKALEVLISKGYLYREHGRGTFVTPPKLQQSLHSLTSFTNDISRRGLEAGQRILSVERVDAPVRVRERLELSHEEQPVMRIERVRLANDEPIGIHIAYLALADDRQITEEEMDRFGSLYELLETKFNIVITEADETLEATAANEREASYLHIREGSPLLLIERTSWTQERRPVEFVKMLYRADRYKYYVHMTR